MKVSRFIDSNLEKGVHDIVFVSEKGDIIHGKDLNYEESEVISVKYQKIAVITIKNEDLE